MIEITPEEIKHRISQGALVREAGDYQKGQDLLESAFLLARQVKDGTLIVEAGNNLSILYRLIAGRAVRIDQLVLAENYSIKSLRIYSQLEEEGFLDMENPVIARNRSHALLYAGYTKDAIFALEHSATIQQDPALQGDEYCHLSFASLSLNDIDQAQNKVDRGLKLVEENNGSKVALTFALMTKASILAQRSEMEVARNLLSQARQIAEANNLAVRLEEIKFMQDQTDTIDVVAAIVCNLPLVRALSREIMEGWKTKEDSTKLPTILLLGGFQGSGKTTIIESLRSKMDLVTISNDQIRHKLFSRGVPFSPMFSQLVEAINADLFRQSLTLNRTVVIDANMTPAKVELIKKLVDQGGLTHKILSVYLQVDKDELVRRITERAAPADRYAGTIDDLEGSIARIGDIDVTAYDLVVKQEDKLTVEQISEIIKENLAKLGN